MAPQGQEIKRGEKPPGDEGRAADGDVLSRALKACRRTPEMPRAHAQQHTVNHTRIHKTYVGKTHTHTYVG